MTDSTTGPTFERGDDGWLAFNDDLRIVSWGATIPEAATAYAESLDVWTEAFGDPATYLALTQDRLQ